MKPAARLALLLALAPALAPPLAAHEGAPLAPHDLWRAWTLEPAVVLGLALAAGGYARGLRRLRRRRAAGGPVRRWGARAFWAGWAVLALALVSPLHALGGALLGAHMAQHELLMVAAAPLLVLGRPVLVALWALPAGARRGIGRLAAAPPVRATSRAIARPLPATLIHGAAIWVWHAPSLYQATLGSEAAHALQHAAFLGTALLFWWALIHGSAGPRGYGVAVLCVFLTALHSGALGALLTLSPSLVYPRYAAGAALWGLTPLEDQQLAGLIMWVPGGLAYLAGALALLAAWLRRADRRAGRWAGGPAGRRTRLAGAGAATLLLLLTLGCGRETSVATAAGVTGGDPDRGRAAMAAYGCGACHTIPGVPGARGRVGPPLAGLAERAYVAGVLPNTPANLVRWIRVPQEVDPLTAMPDLGVGEGEARDMAAYLYTLR